VTPFLQIGEQECLQGEKSSVNHNVFYRKGRKTEANDSSSEDGKRVREEESNVMIKGPIFGQIERSNIRADWSPSGQKSPDIEIVVQKRDKLISQPSPSSDSFFFILMA
jgi:hypothetical protein